MVDTYDLLIVADATASMETYLDALRASIPEILALAKLSGAFSRLGVIAYKDYGDAPEELTAWSGWNTDLAQFASTLDATGGGDYPEAAKTALIRALQAVDKSSRTLILWYTDAPPHHASIKSVRNDLLEAQAFPDGATDWVKLSYIAKRRNCTVFSFTPNSMDRSHSMFYHLLSEITGGISIQSDVDSGSSRAISRLTLSVILQWMGQPVQMDAIIQESKSMTSRYQLSPLDADPKPSDEGPGSRGYLPPSLVSGIKGTPLAKTIHSPLLPGSIPVGQLSSHHFNLATRFADPGEEAYRTLVYESLHEIIALNVASLTYNPIFGQLWRVVCKGQNEQKTHLLNAFSNSVGQLKDPQLKRDIQQWLEDSFDATEEIESIISSVGRDGPMVYLDLDADVELTRVELLEVSRSCYSAVLKKVASIFTHLKIVEPGVKLNPSQRAIPLTLPPRDFFRILPHLVVPGTLYSTRAAALTAILSLVTAVEFLHDAATTLLTPIKGTWLNLEVPENISFDCAKLLLSAPEGAVLNKKEKDTYEAMRRYKLIELNLDSSIEVLAPWTPEKSRNVGDRKVLCKKCQIRRSVTIMSAENYEVCGLCIFFHRRGTKDPKSFLGSEESEACWVECSTKSCRAQYVVEDVPALKIRPRCYYCRTRTKCPYLSCTKCSNRVIIPPRYRSFSDTDAFICPACDAAHRKTIVPLETTTRQLNSENGVAWLGLSTNPDVLSGKSAFKLFQAHGRTIFGSSPSAASLPALTIRRKMIHDPSHALLQVEARVGRGEVQLGSCALCFEEFSKAKLGSACGRSGCDQRVDEGCLREWYGQSEPGKLLNIMQLMCPFCRRKPTVGTILKYNRQAASLGGLQQAMDDRRFFYAWCGSCAFAKPAQERTSCEGDRVPRIENFQCKECLRPPPPPDEDMYARQSSTSAKLQPMGKICRCPSCKVYIEKIDGCNHITCRCGQHFCFTCGDGFRDNYSIYRHLMEAHGGFYDDDDREAGVIIEWPDICDYCYQRHRFYRH